MTDISPDVQILKDTRDVMDFSTSVYSKLRLRAEWNWNRFIHSFGQPGQPVMYRGPNDDFEHPLYIDRNWNVVPTDHTTGKPMVDSQGFIVDRSANRIKYYNPNGDEPDYVKISEVRIAVFADETNVTDENGNDVLVSPDGTILDTDGDGVPYTAVDGDDVYVKKVNGEFLISSITNEKVKLLDVLALRDTPKPVSVIHLPQYNKSEQAKGKSGTVDPDELQSGDYDEDPEYFPLESIIEAERPTKRGNLKMWLTDKGNKDPHPAQMGGLTSQDSGYDDNPGRYYLADVDSKYKYWVGSQDSGTTLLKSIPSYDALSGYDIKAIGPIVNYKLPVRSNKIVIGIDSTIPTGYEDDPGASGYTTLPRWSDVRIEVDNGNGRTRWLTAAKNPTVNDDGKVILYCNGNYDDGTYGNQWLDANDPESWPADTEIDLNNEIRVISVQYRVWRIDRSGVRLPITEISLRLEKDLTEHLISATSSNEMSEHSFVSPFGTTSAGTASVTLSNTDGRYSNNSKTLMDTNTANPYYNLIDKHVLFTLDMAIDKRPVENPEWIRQFTMRSTEWSGDDTTVDVSLQDDSLILQEVKPNKMLMQSAIRKSNRQVDLSAKEIIAQLLDSVGYTNYHFDRSDVDRSVPVKFWWTDGEQTVWDCIGEICQSTQLSAYFGPDGVLQFVPLGDLYRQKYTRFVITAEDTKRTDTSGTDRVFLANAISVNKDRQYEANVVNINYRKASLSKTNSAGAPKMETVWEPSGTVVLRASGLGASLNNKTLATPGRNYSLKINDRDVRSWPYSGLVSVDGELIRYNAKKYWYYNKAGRRVFKYITSNAERSKLNKEYPRLAFRNAFDGRLRIQHRGEWSSYRTGHSVDINGYTFRLRTAKRPVHTWRRGARLDKSNSLVRLATNKSANERFTAYVISRGTTSGEMPRFYGTRLRFPKSGYRDGSAGVAISLGGWESGIYIKLSRTKQVSRNKRLNENELTINVRDKRGYFRPIKKGVATPVSANQWYDLDVAIAKNAHGYTVQAMVNGTTLHTVDIPTNFINDETDVPTGRFGLFVQGNTICDFEYLYAFSDPIRDKLDETGFFDRIKGGYSSGQGDREMVFDTKRRSRVVKKKNRKKKSREYYNYRYNTQFFDDFGPIVHEVREYDVDFDSETPVVHSRLYFSNDYQAENPEYTHSPFGAKFLMVNAYRENAVLSGEDTLTYGSDNSITQAMMIYGRKLNVNEESNLRVADEGAVQRRGETSLDISANWVQTDAAAKELASQILAAWSVPMDSVQVTMFGDPRIRVGDVVSVYAPDAGIGEKNSPRYADIRKLNTYVVNSIQQDYSAGLTTSLGLRSLRKPNNVLSDYEEILQEENNNMVYNPRFEDGEITGWEAGSNVVMSGLAHSPTGRRGSLGAMVVSGKTHHPSKVRATFSHITPVPLDTITGDPQPVGTRFAYVNGDYYYAVVRIKSKHHGYAALRLYGYGTNKAGEIDFKKLEFQAGQTRTIVLEGRFSESGYTEVRPLVYFYNTNGEYGLSDWNRYWVDRMYFRTDPDKGDIKPN